LVLFTKLYFNLPHMKELIFGESIYIDFFFFLIYLKFRLNSSLLNIFFKALYIIFFYFQILFFLFFNINIKGLIASLNSYSFYFTFLFILIFFFILIQPPYFYLLFSIIKIHFSLFLNFFYNNDLKTLI
jgi:hypothetical protein